MYKYILWEKQNNILKYKSNLRYYNKDAMSMDTQLLERSLVL